MRVNIDCWIHEHNEAQIIHVMIKPRNSLASYSHVTSQLSAQAPLGNKGANPCNDSTAFSLSYSQFSRPSRRSFSQILTGLLASPMTVALAKALAST